jgi:hypothetical protein
MKKTIRNKGRTKEIMGTEPIRSKLPPPIPKMFRTECTISIYATMAPVIISIHAISLVFDHNIIARKVAIAPRISWLIINNV